MLCRGGLTRPDGLALGAAMGRPTERSSAVASGCAGTLIASVQPGACQQGYRAIIPPPHTRVIGPGQNASATARALVKVAQHECAPGSATWEISGLKPGRAFASNILATAASLVARRRARKRSRLERPQARRRNALRRLCRALRPLASEHVFLSSLPLIRRCGVCGQDMVLRCTAQK